jgi:hypothetical protein
MNMLILNAIPRGQSRGKRRVVSVSPFEHFNNQPIVSQVQGLQFASPSSGFRMIGVSFLVFGQYGPYGMKLPVLTKEMFSAQYIRRYVPNTHASPLLKNINVSETSIAHPVVTQLRKSLFR